MYLAGAAEHLSIASKDPFVKHVSAVASRFLRPVFHEVQQQRGKGKLQDTFASLQAKCVDAKMVAASKTQTTWEEVNQEMAVWRRLSVEVAAVEQGETRAQALSELCEAWDSVWLRVFHPAL